jgi:hypothetical protein
MQACSHADLGDRRYGALSPIGHRRASAAPASSMLPRLRVGARFAALVPADVTAIAADQARTVAPNVSASPKPFRRNHDPF